MSNRQKPERTRIGKDVRPLAVMLNLVSWFPWWVGVAIALVAYVVLHRMATPVQMAAVQPGQMGSVITQSVMTGLATVGQYIVPLFCLLGALVSLFKRRQRTALLTDMARAQSANALDGMSWREFEILVGEAYRLQGYQVTETGGGGADGGIDLVLTKGHENFLVQCKQWKAFKVGVSVVRELYGVMAAKGVTGGFVVTSGRFTEEAKAFADGRNLELVDGAQLFAMIKQAKQSIAVPQSAAPPMTNASRAEATPACPHCGARMVRRMARKGHNAGAEFWGCAKFPDCRGVRQVGDWT